MDCWELSGCLCRPIYRHAGGQLGGNFLEAGLKRAQRDGEVPDDENHPGRWNPSSGSNSQEEKKYTEELPHGGNSSGSKDPLCMLFRKDHQVILELL